jgi:hypothetical protein
MQRTAPRSRRRHVRPRTASETSKDDNKDTRRSLGRGDDDKNPGRRKRRGSPKAEMHRGKDSRHRTKSRSGSPPARRSHRSPERHGSRPPTGHQQRSPVCHPSPEPQQRPKKPDTPPTSRNKDDELKPNGNDEETNEVSENKSAISVRQGCQKIFCIPPTRGIVRYCKTVVRR